MEMKGIVYFLRCTAQVNWYDHADHQWLVRT